MPKKVGLTLALFGQLARLTNLATSPTPNPRNCSQAMSDWSELANYDVNWPNSSLK